MAMDPEVKALNACIRELDKLDTASARSRIASFVFARYTLGGNADDDPIERMWKSKKLRHAFLRVLSDLPNGPIGEPGCECYVDEGGLHAASCSLHADEQDVRHQAQGIARSRGDDIEVVDDGEPDKQLEMDGSSWQGSLSDAMGAPGQEPWGYCQGCGQDLPADGSGCPDCHPPEDEDVIMLGVRVEDATEPEVET